MKTRFLKATLALVCVVAVGTGSWKSYQAYVMNGNEVDALLTENIEALSDDSDIREFRTQKCYMTEENKGSNEYICPKGTNSSKVYDCPNELDKADPYSASGFCVIEVKK